MYAAALMLTAATTAATVGMPHFQLGAIGPIQGFGVIVAIGVLIGAALLRRKAEWHGISDEHIRHLLGWVTITGFIGAHVFDVLAYQWKDFLRDPVLIIKIWAGISSYGGFIGGALGFAFYVWWKRLPVRLFADVTIVGLLPAFSIGRIGCTLVNDHIGAAVKDPDAWYAAFATDYPTSLNMEAISALVRQHPNPGATITAWNLGFLELLYLIPVNLVILWLAFRPAKQVGDKWFARVPSGFLVVLAGVLYAPVRFFLDYLRLDLSDPRYFGLTFAQWSSILAFGVALYAAVRILANGKPAEVMTSTSRETQERLRIVLKEDEEEAAKAKGKKRAKLPEAKATAAKPKPEAAPEASAKDKEPAKAPAAEAAGDDGADDDAPEPAEDQGDDQPEDDQALAEPAKPTASKPASAGKSSSGGKPSSGGKKGKKGKKR